MPEEICADNYVPETLAVNCYLWCTPPPLMRLSPCPHQVPLRPKIQRFSPSSVKNQRFLPASPEGGKPFLNARVQKTFPTVVDAPKYNAPHLALPLGELSPQVTERGGQWPLTMRACYPGGKPPPLGSPGSLRGGRRENPPRPVCALGTSPIGSGKALPQLLIVHWQSSISLSRRNAALKIWCWIFLPYENFL